ncbi:MAG: type II CRISPR-associated endonuclease Cas1 [Coriobacteriaceae bacterium]|nr:MAG: type II CRISPR-associated endonuclease Cas1 [Coriobacteriaceae bacterium]
MAFRIVSIEHPAEVHARNGQLVVIESEGTASIPIEDIMMLIADAPDIRISTMCLDMLAVHHVMVVTMGRNHMPSSMTIPMVANARQSRVAYAQATMPGDLRDAIWGRIVVSKIQNQARSLAILGLPGAEEVWSFSQGVMPGDPTNREGAAAKCYFQHLQLGLNRRCEDPLNSALNYGYAIVRSLVARSLVSTGFIPAFGIHHHSQLNAFNLADDLMEPLRPAVDLVALGVVGTTCRLSRNQRSKLREVALCKVDLEDRIVSVHNAVSRMSETLRGAINCGDARVMQLPIVRPIDDTDMGVGEKCA